MIVVEDVDMVPWAKFTPEVLVTVGDVPNDMAESYIRQSAIDLATRSQVLVRRIEIPLQACVTEYVIAPPGCERIESIQRIGGGADREGCACTLPCSYLGARFEYPNRMHIDVPPTAGEGGSFWVRAAVVPTRDSCEVDRRFYEQYHEGVVDGALARLFLIKKSSWYDPALASYHKTQAEGRITAAGVDRLTGGARGPFRMRGRRIV